MPSSAQPAAVIAVLGATGRLGRAVVAGLGKERVRGLARHAPVDAQDWEGFVVSDRTDATGLHRALAGAAAVVDLCAFDDRDADALCTAARKVGLADVPLVWASSLAERSPASWADLEASDAVGVSDSYGTGKLAARKAFVADWPGPTCGLLLPQLVALDDANARELAYLHDARALGFARLPGTGAQRPALAPLAAVAAAIVRLVSLLPLPPSLALSHPQPQPLTLLVSALLAGARLPTRTAPHPDPHWRGPHSAGDETVDLRHQQALLPDLAWPDLLVSYRELGRRLALPR